MSMEAQDLLLGWAAGFPEILARASLEGAVFAAAVWLLCRFAPRLPAGLRCGLWWLACLKLLLGLVWTSPVRLPLLPAAGTASLPAVTMVSPPSAADGSRSAPAPRHDPFPWGPTLAALWGAGFLAHLAVAGRRLRRTRGVIRRSAPVGGPVAARFDELSRSLGLRRPPALRSSAEIATPQTAGILSPVVLLPAAGLDRLSAAELAMALRHELAHVRRGDLRLGMVPALAERLFFFHPLAALAAREYALAREAACDAEVLRALGAAPEAYGRLLVRLGAVRRGSPAPRLAAVGAAPAFIHLKRRLQMLQDTSEDRPRRARGLWLAALAGLAAIAGLVPFRVVAQEAVPAAVAVPAVDTVPAVGAVPAVAVPARAAHQAVPVPPTPPRPPVAPRPPKPPREPRLGSGGRNGDAFVLMSGDHSTMSGSMKDVERVRELRGDDDEILWFRRGGKEYVVRDPAKLRAAQELWKPQAQLGARQAELGAQQAELGGKQAELGSRQAALGAKQAELGAQQARLAAQQARLDEDDDEESDKLGDQQDELGRKQDALGRQQDELGEQQDALGSQQDALGRQQDELGRQQDRLSREAEEKFGAMVDRWLADGSAQEVGR